MTSPDKLFSLEEVEFSLVDADLPSGDLARQLADTMRENERLRGLLTEAREAMGWGSIDGYGMESTMRKVDAELQQHKQSFPCKNCGHLITDLAQEKNCIEFEEAVNKAFATKTSGDTE